MDLVLLVAGALALAAIVNKVWDIIETRREAKHGAGAGNPGADTERP